MERACRRCKKYRHFSESRRRSYNWICTQCANRERDGCPASYLARKLGEYLRRRGHVAPYPGVAFVRQVLARHGLQGLRRRNHVMIALKDSNGPLSVDNVRVVNSTEGRRLSHRSAEEIKAAN